MLVEAGCTGDVDGGCVARYVPSPAMTPMPLLPTGAFYAMLLLIRTSSRVLYCCRVASRGCTEGSDGGVGGGAGTSPFPFAWRCMCACCFIATFHTPLPRAFLLQERVAGGGPLSRWRRRRCVAVLRNVCVRHRLLTSPTCVPVLLCVQGGVAGAVHQRADGLWRGRCVPSPCHVFAPPPHFLTYPAAGTRAGRCQRWRRCRCVVGCVIPPALLPSAHPPLCVQGGGAGRRPRRDGGLEGDGGAGA